MNGLWEYAAERQREAELPAASWQALGRELADAARAKRTLAQRALGPLPTVTLDATLALVARRGFLWGKEGWAVVALGYARIDPHTGWAHLTEQGERWLARLSE